MPGVNLNLDLPSLSDSLATIVSKTAAALSAIQNDLTPKVTAGEININAALPFNGNAATGLGSVQLVSGNTPTAAGSVYYLNGEFYAIDATGVIQLTLNGAINASGIGGIVGDYGGVNPARVTYVSASHQYQFTSSPGVWATIVAGNFILEGANGTVQLGVDNAITIAQQVNYKSFPTSGVSFMVFNGATSTIEDGGVTQVTNPLVSTSTIKASVLKFSTGQQVIVPACLGVPGNTSTAAKSYGGTYGEIKKWNWTNDGNTAPIIFPVQVPVGGQITGYGARINKTSGTAGHIHVVLVKCSSNTESNADSGNASGIDYSVNNPGDVQISPTFAVSTSVATAGDQYQIVVYTSGNVSDSLYNVYFTYIIP